MPDEIRELATVAVRYEDAPVVQEALLTALYRCRREYWAPTRRPVGGYCREHLLQHCAYCQMQARPSA